MFAQSIPPRGLQELTNLANQIRVGITNKNQSVSNFNTTLKNRIRSLDALSVQILQKIQSLGNTAVKFQQIIDRQTAEIAESNRRLKDAITSQEQTSQKIQELTKNLQQSQANAAQSDGLRVQVQQLQAQMKDHMDTIQELTSGIDAANGIIGQALADLNQADNTDELNQLLTQLEAHVNQINTEIDNISPDEGPPGYPPPPPPPPPPPQGSKKNVTFSQSTKSKGGKKSKHVGAIKHKKQHLTRKYKSKII